MPRIRLIYKVPVVDPRWVLRDDDNPPETPLHEDIVELLTLVLKAWIARTGRDAMAGSNIALRWNQKHPQVGVDPDVYLVEPAPPTKREVTSLCTWKPGHGAPRVAVEVVSRETADKDYGDGPDKYAASGTKELWVFDPMRFGPATHGGPFALQLWRRVGSSFRRVYAGDGPTFSRELGAWLVVTDEGRRLRIADDAAGARCWPTEAEVERAAKESERAAKEAALAELAALRAQIAQTASRKAARPAPRKRRT